MSEALCLPVVADEDGRPATREVQKVLLGGNLALVSGADGTFLVNRHDVFVGQAIEVYGEYNGIEGDALKTLLKAGDNVIEVGANIGAHTVGLARTVGPTGKVFAFEPQRACFALLQAQIALNQLSNIYAFNEGVGAERGKLFLPAQAYSARGNFGGVSLSDEPAPQSEAVEVVRLDERIGDTPINLIKIDVEGMEEKVIHGARRLILRDKPILYVENDRPANSAALISTILELGYRLWWHIPRLYRPGNHFQVKENIFGGVASFNMLCVHRSGPTVEGLREIKSAGEPHPIGQG